MIGLCLGGGQLALGMTTLAIALATLWALKRLETLLPQERRASLSVGYKGEVPAETEVSDLLSRSGFTIRSWDVTSSRCEDAPLLKVRCELSWRGRQDNHLTPPIINEIARLPGVITMRWNG